MTDLALARPLPRLDPDPVLLGTTLVLLVALVPVGLAMGLDPRTVAGDSVWLKPAKFLIALALYTGTLAAYATWMDPGVRAHTAYRAFTWIVTAAIAGEMAWIGAASLLGTASHYNTAGVWAVLYPLMGILAVTLTAMAPVVGWGILKGGDGLAPAMKLALVLGLMLTFALTVPIAGTLAQLPGHFVGTPVTGAAVPVLGWSREVGDPRIAHFLATHALHVLPLMGLVALALPDAQGRALVWASAAGFSAVTLAVFAQALAGRPLFPV